MVEISSLNTPDYSSERPERGVFNEQAFWLDVQVNWFSAFMVGLNTTRGQRNNLHAVQLALEGATGELSTTVDHVLKEQRVYKNREKIAQVVRGFFKENHLEEQVEYGKTIYDLLRDHGEDVMKRLQESSSEKAFSTPKIEILFQLLDDVSSVPLLERLLQHPEFSKLDRQVVRNFLKRNLSNVYSPEEWQKLQAEGMDKNTVWDRKGQEIKKRMQKRLFVIPPVQRKLVASAIEVVSQADRNATGKSLLAEIAQKAGMTQNQEDYAETQLFEAMNRLYTKEEMRTFGVGVSIWNLLKDRHPAVMDIVAKQQVLLPDQERRWEIVRYALKNLNVDESVTVHEVAKHFGMSDEAQVRSLLISELKKLYRPEELEKFYDQKNNNEPVSFPDKEVDTQPDIELNVDDALFEGDGLGVYVLQAKQASRLLSADEEITLAQARDAGDKEAVTKLVLANLLWVVKLAQREKYKGIPLLDLIQEGNIALMRAAQEFDWRRGLRFTTYSNWKIRRAMQYTIANNRIIHLPVLQQYQARKVAAIYFSLEETSGKAPTPAELAAATNLNEKETQEYLTLLIPVKSLQGMYEQKGQPDEGDNYEEFVTGEQALSAEAQALIKMAPEEIIGVMETAHLTKIQQAAIILYYGFDGVAGRTDTEVGEEIGKSRASVEQARRTGIASLKRSGSAMKFFISRM